MRTIPGMLRIDDGDRVRTLTLDRPEALNAFSGALYEAVTAALAEAADDPGVAVVVITGAGRAFSAGQDLAEMAALATGGQSTLAESFSDFVDALVAFPKPLLCAVNGLALGIGVTMLGFADLTFMSTEARARCPFTALAVAPEAGSSATFPRLLGRQDATWALLSSEWLSAQECHDMGLAWKLCEPGELLDETLRHAGVLASKPIAALIEGKAAMLAPLRVEIAAARERENAAFQRMLGSPANVEALTAFLQKREPDFAAVDARTAGA